MDGVTDATESQINGRGHGKGRGMRVVDQWRVKESKKLVMETLMELSNDHCLDCGAGNLYVTFRVRQPVGLEYYTKCKNCGKEQVF